ncbi:MAG: hypothetical protein JWN67_414 [Actinomycetia bacterium]|nr:hypothetical protein [Actinomycetes bacterium]
MSVVELNATNNEGVDAELRWSQAPSLSFHIHVEPDGRVTELRVRAIYDPTVGLTHGMIGTRDLRSVPVGLMQRAVRTRLADHARAVRASAEHLRDVVRRGHPELEVAVLGAERGAEYAETVLAELDERPRPGAAGRGDRHYAVIAAIYVGLLDDGVKAPVAELARRLTVSPSTARNYLFTARERGLLTSVGQGRSGGVLTEAAERLLEKGA